MTNMQTNVSSKCIMNLPSVITIVKKKNIFCQNCVKRIFKQMEVGVLVVTFSSVITAPTALPGA